MNASTRTLEILMASSFADMSAAPELRVVMGSWHTSDKWWTRFAPQSLRPKARWIEEVAVGRTIADCISNTIIVDKAEIYVGRREYERKVERVDVCQPGGRRLWWRTLEGTVKVGETVVSVPRTTFLMD
jgi:hypothetical protein